MGVQSRISLLQSMVEGKQLKAENISKSSKSKKEENKYVFLLNTVGRPMPLPPPGR